MSKPILDICEANRDVAGFYSVAQEEDAKRYHAHGIFPYPAMMVPRLQGELIDVLLRNINREHSVIFDPFMGSGTVLSESISRGADFYGSDVNPLSLLCCQVKSDYFDHFRALDNIKKLSRSISRPGKVSDTIEFSGSKKWFHWRTLRILAFLHNRVQGIEDIWCRRIFWLALAETARRFSKTRMSTYKLHIDKEYSYRSQSDVIDFFIAACKRNVELKASSWKELSSCGYVEEGMLAGRVELELSDVRCISATFEADLIVTSPPYGDNKTTVTYGQFSFLPLQFIDLDDIECSFDRSLIETISGIDSASLGGSLLFWKDKLDQILPISESLHRTYREVNRLGKGGEKRLIAFSYDLWESLISIGQRLRQGGYAMITLGNRKINGVLVPLDEIVEQFLSSLGLVFVNSYSRKIKNKRMAGSMNTETILVMTKL